MPQWSKRKKRVREKSEKFRTRREQTARDLLEAARRILAAKGYHRARIADIARAARMGVGTFYLYYPTKEALFIELVEDTVQKLKRKFDAARENASGPEALSRERMKTFFRFAQDNRELFRIAFGHEAAFHEVVQRSQEIFAHDIVEGLEEGMRAGVFRQGRADILAQAFIGMSLQAVSWWLTQEEVPMEEVMEELSDFASRAIAAD